MTGHTIHAVIMGLGRCISVIPMMVCHGMTDFTDAVIYLIAISKGIVPYIVEEFNILVSTVWSGYGCPDKFSVEEHKSVSHRGGTHMYGTLHRQRI
jgi:hypothetical protein